MKDGLRAMLSGTTGGLLGGGLAGVLEAIYLLATAAQVTDYQVLPFAAVLYGLLGAVIGSAAAAAVQLPAMALRRPLRAAKLWALGVVAPGCALGLSLALWILPRDFYDGGVPDAVIAGLIVASAVGAAALLVLLAGLGERTMLRALASPSGGLAGYGAVVLFLGLLHLGSSHMDPPPPAGHGIPTELLARPNVVLIGVGSLRADHLGCYGAPDEWTPAIDEFAAESVVYEQAVVPSPRTRASVASLLSGRLPSSHRTYGSSDRLRAEVVTLAEVLADEGYVTAARITDPDLVARFGLHQGFAEYTYLPARHPLWASQSSYFLVLYEALHGWLAERRRAGEHRAGAAYRDAAEVTDAGIDALRAHAGERFLLWLQYSDPREPYHRHPYDGYAVARGAGAAPSAGRADELRALYRGEVAFADAQLGRLFAFLREEGLFDESLIVLFADHGEALGAHGHWWHGDGLHDEQIRVPLVVHYPDGFRYRAGTRLEPPADDGADDEAAEPAPVEVFVDNGSRVAEQVRSIDVAPTVAGLAGVAELPASWQGTALTGVWDEREAMDQLAFAEVEAGGRALTALRGGGWKLIESRPLADGGERACELYNLDADPAEQVDLCGCGDVEPRRRELHEQLVALRAVGGDPVAGDDTGLDPATCRQLQALGYVDPSVDCGGG